MQGASVSVTNDKLDITDGDTEVALLSFMLLEKPEHGEIWANGFKLNPGEEFFQPDITAGDVEYRHDDGDSRTDIIKLEASDNVCSGITVIMSIFNITSSYVRLKKFFTRV
jgi:hypothetical protein